MTTSDIPRRKRIRLDGYDYAQPGAYYVTICTHQSAVSFGKIENGVMIPNRFGMIVDKCWHDLPNHYKNIELDAFVVMPNHMHGIIVIHDDVCRDGSITMKPHVPATDRGGSLPMIKTTKHQEIKTRLPINDIDKTRPYPKPFHHGLPEVVRAFKSFSARRINAKRKTPGITV